MSLAVMFGTDASALNGLTYQGRIVRADGTPVESPNVTITVQIKSPGSENCLLFQETHMLDMSNSKGVFSLSIGAGTRVSSSIDGGFSMSKIFANRAVAVSPLPTCDIGSAYIPNAADTRKIVISFNDGSGVQTLESQTMAFVPYSIEASQIGGFDINQLLRVDGAITTPMNSAEYTELTKLVTGVSTQYSKANQLAGSDLPAMTTGQSLRWNGSAWEGFSAGTVVNSIQAGTGLSANGTPGGTLTSSGTLALTNTGVTVGAYGGAAAIPRIQVDAQGRVVSASEIALTSVATFTGNLAGDVTGTQAATSVSKIQGMQVASTTPLSNQVFKYDGMEWKPYYVSLSDVRNAAGFEQIPLTCTSSETMTYDSINDKLVCTAATISNFSGALAGDVTGVQGATTVAQVGGVAAADVATGANLANAATNANTASTIVKRDASGDFAAGTISAAGLIVGTDRLVVTGGNVGINTASPQTKLDVDGAIRFAMDATSCSATIAGAQRYNAGAMEYCNGTDWLAYGAAGAGVQSITAGAGLSGGTINSSGTIALADIGAHTVLANTTGGTASPLATTPSDLIDTISSTRGTLLYRGASGWTALNPGTSGQLLKTQGAGADPAWADEPSTGTLTALTGDVTASGVGAVAATVAQVGGVTAANVATGANLANAATNANTASAIVKRDASGNFSAGIVTATGFVGPLTGTATNTTQIQGQPVDATAPTGAGQLLRWDGSKYVAANLQFEDLKSSAALAQFPTTCSTTQVMIYSSLSDTFECQNITLANTTSIMSGDVTGSITSNTVGQVGGVTAANVATGATLANAATNANTASTIVKRDASGNFFAGTVTANLAGNVTGNLTGNVTTLTTKGDLLTSNGANNSRLPAGSDGQLLVADSAQANGLKWSAPSALTLTAGQITAALTFTPVNKAGDTMSGALNLPANGLTVGTNQLVVSGGNVGVGTASPSNALDVQGSIRARIYDNGSSRTIDWSLGNVQYTTADCNGTNFTMNNLLDGGSYTLILKASSHGGLCAFTGSSVTNWRFRPAAYQPSGYVVLTFLKAGSDVFIAWSDNY